MAAPASDVKELNQERVGIYRYASKGSQTESGQASRGYRNDESDIIPVTTDQNDVVTITLDRQRVGNGYYGSQSAPSLRFGRTTSRQSSHANSATSRILRFQLSKSILQNLMLLQDVAQMCESATPAAGVMRDIIQFRDTLPDDPLTDVLIALYDSMTSQEQWSRYSTEQYSQAHEILKGLISEKHLHHLGVRRAISQLESCGFSVSLRSNSFEVWHGWGEDERGDENLIEETSVDRE